MEWILRMKNAIDFLEQNIEGKADIKKAAKIAYCSVFHFQRMFHVLTGVTIAEYIRRRKLTLAAQELKNGAKVIETALKYGYETPESFTKAFKKLHGVSPNKVRQEGIYLKAFPKISFHISIKGDKDMEYKFITKEPFKVIGKEIRVTMEGEENFKTVPGFWQTCKKDGTYDKMCQLAGSMGMFGICKDYDKDFTHFTYMIAVEKTDKPMPAGFVEYEVPKANWAVFKSVGPMPNAIKDIWKRIFSEWIAATDYQVDEKPQLEVYPEGDITSDNYECEIWIPIKK